MEALTAVQVALLTIYDMCKAVDRGMSIHDVRVVEKHGGKSGSFVAGLRGEGGVGFTPLRIKTELLVGSPSSMASHIKADKRHAGFGTTRAPIIWWLRAQLLTRQCFLNTRKPTVVRVNSLTYGLKSDSYWPSPPYATRHPRRTRAT